MGMNRKIKRNAKKSTNILENIDLDFLKAGLGVSEKVGEREPFSSGRITERIGDKRPTENQLLEKFSKTKISLLKYSEDEANWNISSKVSNPCKNREGSYFRNRCSKGKKWRRCSNVSKNCQTDM